LREIYRWRDVFGSFHLAGFWACLFWGIKHSGIIREKMFSFNVFSRVLAVAQKANDVAMAN
jgi:hypothetical protein